MADKTNKSLGQHWLKDRSILESIAIEADLTASDTVLEIGPGLGTLTSVLLASAKKVVAVEFDEALASKLSGQFPGKSLEVVSQDIVSFNLDRLPAGYKVVANVPYYITSKIVRKILTGRNKPSKAVLLVQKEVAERIAASPGALSLLAIGAQVFAEVSLGATIEAKHFTPPPRVDSRVVVLTVRTEPLISEELQPMFFRVVKAGFSAKRKKLRSSLAGGLDLSKSDVDKLLNHLGLGAELRAQELSIDDWRHLANAVESLAIS